MFRRKIHIPASKYYDIKLFAAANLLGGMGRDHPGGGKEDEEE